MAAERTVLSERSHSEPKDDDEYDDDDDDDDNFSRSSANGHIFRPGGKKSYIDSCLKPLYNGHFLLSPRWPL